MNLRLKGVFKFVLEKIRLENVSCKDIKALYRKNYKFIVGRRKKDFFKSR